MIGENASNHSSDHYSAPDSLKHLNVDCQRPVDISFWIYILSRFYAQSASETNKTPFWQHYLSA